ncbi:hypothetical protein COY28_01720 [Candidatus Woesearchaeota archaeon CG_4_10_14_0_2_um_filter_57_5]|nr:MAG: hypothetical protein COY28_01720 [Candidatus Woesearchaeota archaeon CG_4_10_14_0_2_um_filter_57_5]
MQELLTSPRIPDDAMRYSFAPYEGLAKELNEYYQWLCEPRKPWNISVYELRGSLAVREHVHLIEQPLTSTLKLDASGFAQMLEQVRLLDEIMQRIGVPFENPYWHFKKGGRGIESGMQHALASAAQALRSLATFIEGLPCKATTFAQLEALASISRELQALRAPHWLLTNISDEQPRLARLHALHERKAALRSSLLSMVTTRFLSQQMPSGLRCPWWRRLFSSEYRTARAALRPFAIRRMSHGSWIRAFSLLEEHRQIEKDISKESAKSRHYQATSASVVGKYHRMAEKAGALREQASALGSADAILQHLAKANADIVGEFRQKAGDVNWFFSKEVFPLVTVKSAGSALGQLQNLLGTLTDCIAFRDTYGKLDAEVSGFVNAAAADTSGKGTAACFVKAYHHQALAQVMRTNARNAPKELAERYRKEDHKVRDMHRYRIMATIEAAQPKQHYHTSGGTSEVAILKREHEKKRKLKPIRSLLSSMPNLAFALKPCFMMSPLTVSQYIDPEKIQFDMVIFDEASQIMPEDALPALMRAKQAIIMGDTQQLPPTSFFQKDNEDTIATGAGSGSATEIIDDLDSFLAEATTTFPEFSLLWHYRSRDERLIAFSNQQFYNSRLITFPQCGGAGGVSVVHVKGAYERGGSRMNLREAEKVAELFIEERKKNASIGLIAFSVQQERAIREALEARGVTLDESIDPSSEEPFIKNLETVQGDERDIIIISVGYAHDAAGRLTLNFGPLNQEGGYKRLNVAVTRARVKTIMVTGLSPQDLAHAKGQGPKVLHDYLAYAHQVRHGGAVAAHQRIATHTRGDGVRTDDTLLLDDFQQSVHDALRRQYQIDTLVGRSGYRLDFALKDKKGDSYVLGVECDGSFYRAAPLARDRDKVRHELLLSLGWTLYRVYSEDWIVSREHVMDSVKESLGRRQTAEASKDDAAEHPTGKDGFAKVRSVKTFSEIPLRERYSSYQQARLPRYGKARFAERSGAVMRQVLETEGIVHEEYLLSRVRGAFGVANTQVARAALKDTLRRMGAQRSGHSVWLRGDTAPVVRVSTEQQRAFKWVPKEELALAVQDVLSINMSMTEEDLARDVIAGIYGRTATAAAKRQVHDAVVSLEKAGKLTREGSGKSATLRIR